MNLQRRANASHEKIASADARDEKQACERRALSMNIDRCKKNNDFIERHRVVQRASSIALRAFECGFVRNCVVAIIKQRASRSHNE
jgi:hypothetical protein